MHSIFRFVTTVIFFSAIGTTHWTAALAQQEDPKQQIDPARLNEVNALLRELKGLLSEYGMGHPKVQDLLRRIKLVEEEVRFEQTFVERIAAQLQSTEEELRNRQKQDWIRLSTMQEELDEDAGGTVPSLETIDALERDCLLELQKIEREEAAEKAVETRNLGNSLMSNKIRADELRLKAQQLARDSIRLQLDAAQKEYASEKALGGRGQASARDLAASALAVQVFANELKVAETNLEAAELELTIKKEMVQNSSAEQMVRLKARREAVEAHLKSIPKLKELARQTAQSFDSTDQTSEQIREIEAQRFQYQTKMVEQQALLDMIRQAMSPQAPARGPSKKID